MRNFIMVSYYAKGTKCKIRCHGALVVGRIVPNYPHPLLGGWGKTLCTVCSHSPKWQSCHRVGSYWPFQQALKYWKKSGRAECFWKSWWQQCQSGSETTGALDVQTILCVATSFKTCHLPLLHFLAICLIISSPEALLRQIQIFTSF